MNIAIIHGQNHKGSSYHTGRLLVDQIPGEHEIAEFFLPRDLNHFCLGCYRCIERDEDCPWYEQKQAIVNAMERADLLVFTTPTYCMAPSASMKTVRNIHETKARFSDLVAHVERHGTVAVVCRHGKPVADLVPHRGGNDDPLASEPALAGARYVGDPLAPLASTASAIARAQQVATHG